MLRVFRSLAAAWSLVKGLLIVLALFGVWFLQETKLAAFKADTCSEIAELHREIADLRADMSDWVSEFRANNPERWDVPNAPARKYAR